MNFRINNDDLSKRPLEGSMYTTVDMHHTQTSHCIRVKRTIPPVNDFTSQLIYPAAWGCTTVNWCNVWNHAPMNKNACSYLMDRVIRTTAAIVIKFIRVKRLWHIGIENLQMTSCRVYFKLFLLYTYMTKWVIVSSVMIQFLSHVGQLHTNFLSMFITTYGETYRINLK
jgi:hypothetical protein